MIPASSPQAGSAPLANGDGGKDRARGLITAVVVIAAMFTCGCVILGEVVKQLPAPGGTPTSVPQATATPAPSGTAIPTVPPATESPSPAPDPTATPGPIARETPVVCPVAVKVGAAPLGNYFRDFQARSCTWVDLTLRFAGKFCPRQDGCPVNSEHHEVATINGKNESPWRPCEPDGQNMRWVLVEGVTSVFAPRHSANDPANVWHGQQVAICGRTGTPWIIRIDLEDGARGGDDRPVTKQWGWKPTILRGTFR